MEVYTFTDGWPCRRKSSRVMDEEYAKFIGIKYRYWQECDAGEYALTDNGYVVYVISKNPLDDGYIYKTTIGKVHRRKRGKVKEFIFHKDINYARLGVSCRTFATFGRDWPTRVKLFCRTLVLQILSTREVERSWTFSLQCVFPETNPKRVRRHLISSDIFWAEYSKAMERLFENMFRPSEITAAWRAIIRDKDHPKRYDALKFITLGMEATRREQEAVRDTPESLASKQLSGVNRRIEEAEIMNPDYRRELSEIEITPEYADRMNGGKENG